MPDSVLILVVEDERLVSDVTELALTDGGYEIASAATGEEAISMLESGEEYRVLVTDINLKPGGKTGWDVAKRGRELNPDLPVVYVTGGEGAEWPVHGVPNSVLIAKPFAPSQIVTAVSQLLNGGTPPNKA